MRLLNYLDVYHKSRVRSRDLTMATSCSDAHLRRCQIRRGDIFFTPSSEIPNDIGRSAVAIEDIPDGVFSYHVVRLRPRTESELDIGFAVYAFSTSAFLGQASRLCEGSGTRYVITLPKFRSMMISLPPTVDEQRTIAVVLSELDKLIDSVERLVDKKMNIKHGVMRDLLSGRSRLPGFSGPFTNKRIGDIADVDTENLSSTTHPKFAFNYISLDNVEGGRLHGHAAMTFSSAPSRARRVLRHGDVLMATVRPRLMGHLLFNGQVSNAIASTGFAVLRCRPHLAEPGFLFAHLFGSVVDRQVEALLVGSNYPAISSADVGNIRVSCPPTVEEQQAIASALQDMEMELLAIRRYGAKTRAIKQSLMQQLLTGQIRLESEPANSP